MKILLTGGIGDVFTIDSYLSDRERESIDTIYYATRCSKVLIDLFTNLPTFPNLKSQVELYTDFSKRFAFYTKLELARVIRRDLKRIEDFSIKTIFPQVRSARRKYTYSSFLAHKMADVTLPENYVVICPYTGNAARTNRRNFSVRDWENTLLILKELGLQGVVLNTQPWYVPAQLINLTGTLRESIEILKGAKGYIGIDSCLSVLASKLPLSYFVVKSSGPHLMQNKGVYYAPLKKFDFIVGEIKKTSQITNL